MDEALACVEDSLKANVDLAGGVVKDKKQSLRMKRVDVKGVEFDWVFNNKEGDKLLRELSETKNKGLFGLEIIKDIIYYQWSYFKRAIIIRMFIPFIVYFITFSMYVSWTNIKRNEEEDEGIENGTWYIVNLCF
jgi:hypothetical protein